MDYQKARRIYAILSLAGLGLVLIGLIVQLLELKVLLIIVGFVLLLYSSVINYRHNRCPHCEAHLSYRLFSISEYCPKCGSRL